MFFKIKEDQTKKSTGVNSIVSNAVVQNVGKNDEKNN